MDSSISPLHQGPQDRLRQTTRPGRRRLYRSFELLEPRLTLSHGTPVDLGDGLGPKFIGDGVTTIAEDFSDNPNHEDPATVPGAVDISEAQGERLFTHIPSPATPVHVSVLDLPPAPTHHYVLLTGRAASREIAFRGIHPDYEVAAINLEWVTDGISQIEIVGQGGTIVVLPADPFHFWENIVTTRGAIVPATQQELGSIQSIRVVSLTAFQTAIDNITILISPKEINDPPIAWDDEVFLPPNTPTAPTSIRIDVLDNDDDPEGRPLALVSVSPAANGAAAIEDDLVRYTPEIDFHGRDSFQYTVSDHKGLTATATVRVGVNTPPIADSANFFFPHGTQGPVVVPAPGLLESGFDSDGDPLQARLVGQPQHGTVSVQPDGSFTYTPTTPDGLVLPDVFSYAVSDGFQFSNLAFVGINVPNQPPVASGGTINYTHATSSPLQGSLPALDGDDDPLTAIMVQDGEHGRVTRLQVVSGRLEFDYEPILGRAIGSDLFSYQLTDGYVTSSPATVILQVPNNPPVAEHYRFEVHFGNAPLGTPVQLAGNLVEPGELWFNERADSFDPDGDPIWAVRISTPPARGRIEYLHENGDFLYIPNDPVFGSDRFGFVVTDGYAESPEGFVEIIERYHLTERSDTFITTSDSPLLLTPLDLVSNDTFANGLPVAPYVHGVTIGCPFYDFPRSSLYSADGEALFNDFVARDEAFEYRPHPDVSTEDYCYVIGFGPSGGFEYSAELHATMLFKHTADPQSDVDGVPDVIEEGAPNFGDGNFDGIADSQQAHVASLPAPGTSPPIYVTLVAEPGISLWNVFAVDGNFNSLPPGVSLPFGLYFIHLAGLAQGEATTVRMILSTFVPDGFTYYKNDSDLGWYPFEFDGLTGAETHQTNPLIPANEILLHFKDGNRGDDNSPSNVIYDPGGPALIRPTAAPRIDSVIIDDGHVQRSKINSITVNFDSVVAIDAGAFELIHDSGIRIALDVAASVIDGQTSAALTFRGNWIIGGSLFNGDYTLVVRGDKIHNQAGVVLDGNNDGAAGGDNRTEFFRRFGDGDGDGDVDRVDRKQFHSTFLRRAGDADYLWYFDWNDDGRIAVIDLLAFTVASFGPSR